jgi:transketolase
MTEGGDFQAGSYQGRNFHFGIREHAMGAILNGMALSKVRAYGSGFLIFSDYMRAPIRLSSLMEIPVMYIFTHDSIGVGEDGPTHQPIEQLVSLRAIPQLLVIRPADGNEVAEAWRVMMTSSHHPIALILSRQPLPTVDRSKYAAAAGLRHGAYVLADSVGVPEVIFMGTGSELQLCVAAHEQLTSEGIKSRVVSMPCWELFERQPEEYRESVLPASVRARVAVEAGTSLGWRRYTGIDGHHRPSRLRRVRSTEELLKHSVSPLRTWLPPPARVWLQRINKRMTDDRRPTTHRRRSSVCSRSKERMYNENILSSFKRQVRDIGTTTSAAR